MNEMFAKITYKDINDKVQSGIIAIPKDIISKQNNYRESVESLALNITDDGFIWIDKDTMIPYNRILEIKCIGEDGRIVNSAKKEIEWICNKEEKNSEMPKPPPNRLIKESDDGSKEEKKPVKIVKINRFFRGKQ